MKESLILTTVSYVKILHAEALLRFEPRAEAYIVQNRSPMSHRDLATPNPSLAMPHAHLAT